MNPRVLKHAIRVLAVLCFSWRLSAADIPKIPVPKSPYLPVIYRFADAMLEKGRDTYGPLKTGMFLSALNRETLAPLTNRPTAPEGVREEGRVGTKSGPLTGSNPQHDENLLRLLYLLSELSSKPKYREAADASLKWFLENTPTTQQFPWRLIGAHDFFRPWLLWDHCFEIAPDSCKHFALALRPHEIANHNTTTMPDLRTAGFHIRTWAVAYSRTKDPLFLNAVETLLGRFELPPAGTRAVSSKLSLAVDCDGATRLVPEPLASRLQKLADLLDAQYCALPHDLKTRGFHVLDTEGTQSILRLGYTPLWKKRDVETTTAQVGMMCLSRYDNTARIDYRKLVIEAADAYLKSLPADSDDIWPATFGQAISLQVGAWRHTASPQYLDRARQLADIAVEKFWGTNALPRASFKTDHYESITGADTLALALVELHLNILHITAVRCPPNTIDR